MTALRWFLSYLLPMLILSSITAAYFYRDQISSDWYQTLSWPVTQINSVLQKQKIQLNIVEPALALNAIPETISEAEVKHKLNKKNPDEKKLEALNELELKPESIAISSDTQAIIQEQPKIPTLPKKIEVVTKSIPNKTLPEIKSQAQPHYMPYPQQRMMPPIRYPSGTRSMHPRFGTHNFNPRARVAPKPPTQFKLTKKQQKLLYQARKAYWTKDLKKAKKYYLTLTKQIPDNPDVQGELGNLFYFDHKLEKAIKHYTLAAKLLIKHRHYWKLPQIMKIVSRFNPTKASEVMKLLRNRNNVITNKSKKGK